MNRKADFIFLGNSHLKFLPNREIHFAMELAKSGFNVIYVEEMPSFFRIARDYISKKYLAETYNTINNNFKIVTSPVIPTSFRSSYTRQIDKLIFNKFFDKVILKYINERTVFYVSSPVWIYFLKERLNDIGRFIYDVYDHISISSRNLKTQLFQQEYEILGLKNSKYPICSSSYINDYYKKNYNISLDVINNGISEDIVKQGKNRLNPNKTKSIGAISPLIIGNEVYDLEILKHTAKSLPDFYLEIIGSYHKTHNDYFSSQKNVKLLGPLFNDALFERLALFDICLIPFQNNNVTDFINPLKMYEYLAFGKKIVASGNFDYLNLEKYVSLSANYNNFIELIITNYDSITFNDMIERNNIANNHSWKKRVEEMLCTLNF